MAAAAPPPLPSDAEVLREVGEEVFFETFRLVRGLSPLQAPWLGLGASQAVGAAAEVGTWSFEGHPPLKVLKRRWPELVPGARALDLLAHLMVDEICR